MIPLAILSALKPHFQLPRHVKVDELLRDPARKLQAFAWGEPWLSWRNCFLALDRA